MENSEYDALADIRLVHVLALRLPDILKTSIVFTEKAIKSTENILHFTYTWHIKQKNDKNINTPLPAPKEHMKQYLKAVINQKPWLVGHNISR